MKVSSSAGRQRLGFAPEVGGSGIRSSPYSPPLETIGKQRIILRRMAVGRLRFRATMTIVRASHAIKSLYTPEPSIASPCAEAQAEDSSSRGVQARERGREASLCGKASRVPRSYQRRPRYLAMNLSITAQKKPPRDRLSHKHEFDPRTDHATGDPEGALYKAEGNHAGDTSTRGPGRPQALFFQRR